MNTSVIVETKDVITRIKALQKEIEQHKKDMDGLIDDAYLEVAAQKLGYKSLLKLKT